MTAKDLKDRIESLCTHVLFDYNGKACGVEMILWKRIVLMK